MHQFQFGRVGFLLILAGSFGCTKAAETPADATADAATSDDATDDSASGSDTAADTLLTDGTDSVVDYGNPDCDPLMTEACTLPWPSNLYLKADTTRKTGYTLTFGATSLPKNIGLNQVAPEPYARMDGYGLGTHLLMVWPNLDVTASALATEGDLTPSTKPDAAILWLEVGKDGKVIRQIPYWTELDLQPVNDPSVKGFDLSKRVLFVRAGVVLHEGARYVIAVRGLKNKDGKTYESSPAFKALVAGKTKGTTLEARQARFDDIFSILDAQGVKKDSLLLAWDFVTASGDTLHGRMLEMRDKALAVVGDKGPEITVTDTLPPRADHPDEVANLAVELTGTFKVPNYMEIYDGPNKLPMYRFHYGKDGNLEQNGWRDAKFWLRIPKSAVAGNPQELVEYGHGLDGAGDEIHQGWEAIHSNQRNLVYFACNMIGMSEDDEPSTLMMLNDFNYWHSLPERVTAGVVEYTLLQLAMREQIEKLDWVKTNKVKFVKDKAGKIPVYYSGNSQGGIYGQTVLAVSPFVQYAHLGQAGINYSNLLHRSVDFYDPFFPILKGVWPDPVDQAILLSTIQILWDTVDPIAYVHHISEDPLPGTMANKAALIVVHPGDFQVAPVTEEINVRSDNGIKLMKNYGHPVPLVSESEYPQQGSGLVSIDFGNGFAPYGNWPPPPKFGPPCQAKTDCPKWPSYNECKPKALDMAGNDCKADADCFSPFTRQQVSCIAGKCDATKYCMVDDPHDRAHGLKAHNDQMLWFFHNGEIKDFCGGDGCNPE